MELSEIKKIVKRVVQKLVNEEFESLYQDDYWKRCDVADIKRVLAEYGGTLTMPPEIAFDKMEIYAISKEKTTLDCTLWNNGEESDLTLVCELKVVDGQIRYAVEDLLVK